MKTTIPKEVIAISNKLLANGHEVYLVGGCVRDLLMSREPNDWDIATNAKPEEVQKIFPDSVYENQFGTVAVKATRGTTRNSQISGTRNHAESVRELAPEIIEVTTFRLEGKYTDKRHPDEIKFAKTIEEDLARRDFTINSMALDLQSAESKAQSVSDSRFALSDLQVVDPYGGQEDLRNKIIRAVGNPEERFQEDALRLMRALRFSAQLGFGIEFKTKAAVKKHANLLEFIAKERIRDEMEKLLMTERAHESVQLMKELGLLHYVLPELEEGFGMEQNKHHKYTVFEHNLRSLEYATQKNFSLELRIASLLHDVGKARTRVWKDDPEGEKIREGVKGDWTFYQHQYVGERLTLEALDRLHFSRRLSEKVALLVREHMFVYDPEIVTERGVRRLVRRVGPENIDDLLLVREADRIGSGVAKAQPYRLRHLKAMIEKAKTEPIHPKMLKIKGDAVMEILKIEPGPKVGKILAVLLDEVLDDPSLNEGDWLKSRVKELGKLPEKELDKLAEKAKESAEEAQRRIDAEIMKKYFVK